ncbi:hypothetical protein GCM10009612_58570 [Streptomyces beijiangensis]
MKALDASPHDSHCQAANCPWGVAVHDEFLCHVTAYGVCGGRRVGVPLGTYRAPNIALALWWLRDRATWISERLDPSPDCGYFPAQALFPMTADAPDIPAALRTWRDEAAQQESAAEVLTAGRLMRYAVRDETTEFELLAESVDALRMQRAIPIADTPAAESQPDHRGPLVTHANINDRGEFSPAVFSGLPSGAALLTALESSTVVFSSAAG